MSSPLKTFLVIGLTLLVAMSLAVWPLPDWARPYRPDWVALALIYWVMAVPQRIGVGSGWLLGLLLDVLTGTLLGVHALGLALVAWVVLRSHQRLRVYRLWQQSLVVFVLVLLRTLLTSWLAALGGAEINPLLVWAPAVAGAVLWPWLFVLLRDMRRRSNIR